MDIINTLVPLQPKYKQSYVNFWLLEVLGNLPLILGIISGNTAQCLNFWEQWNTYQELLQNTGCT